MPDLDAFVCHLFDIPVRENLYGDFAYGSNDYRNVSVDVILDAWNRYILQHPECQVFKDAARKIPGGIAERSGAFCRP